MSDTIATPRQLLEQTHTLILEGRFDAYADLFADDAVFEIPFAPPGVPRRIEGGDAIRALFRAGAERAGRQARLTGIDYREMHETTDPEVVVAEFEVHGEQAGGEGPFTFSDVIVLRAREGRILSIRDYWSPLDRVDLRAPAEGGAV
ncbi:MAG TPA: nuclear transport factor 2 family protein [Candidatus Dormibacteraeota bacterium]|jgi:hypothetical protein|nr:nuclear transport factor 2 family protein [Candidatus Dormibacteraeota bacterium]